MVPRPDRKASPLSLLPQSELHELLRNYGPWAVGVVVGLESMGIPLPGETILIAAAIYAASHDHNIWLVITAAASGAIIGDNVGFWIGREFGYRLLLKFGGYLGLTEGKIKLGQYLFIRHGSKVVFFGRFVAVLRVLAAFLAGVNRMSWGRFMVANAAGGILWATAIGLGAYYFGKSINLIEGPIGIAVLAIAVAFMVGFVVFLRRNEAAMQAEAERAIPGPLVAPGLRRRGGG